MTRIQQRQGADAVAGAQRAGRLGRLRWTRALPGGVAMIAALTFPEFSVGAGEFADAKREPDPVKPPSATGQDLIKQRPNATKQPLAGIRYGALLDIAETGTRSAAAVAPVTAPMAVPSAEAASLPQANRAPLVDVSLGKGRLAPMRPVSKDELDAAATYAASVLDSYGTPTGQGVTAPRAPRARTLEPLASADALDAAVSYAASVLDSYVAPPGLGAEVSLAASAPAPETPVAVDALDAAANYTASVLDSFVPPPAVVQAPTVGRDPAPTSAFESGSADQRAMELVPTPVKADLAGDPGLSPPVTAPLVATASAMSQLAALPSAALAPAVSKPAPQAAALAPLPKPPALAPAPGLGTDTPFALDVKAQLVTRVDGKAAGTVDFQQTATGLTVRLGSIVDVLGDRYDPAQIARIRASAASNLYLSLADLQAQGIPISYDPVYDEFNVGQTDTRPKAARKVHMDQISTPERGLGTTAMDQVRR